MSWGFITNSIEIFLPQHPELTKRAAPRGKAQLRVILAAHTGPGQALLCKHGNK